MKYIAILCFVLFAVAALGDPPPTPPPLWMPDGTEKMKPVPVFDTVRVPVFLWSKLVQVNDSIKIGNYWQTAANGTDGYVLTTNGAGWARWVLAPGAAGGSVDSFYVIFTDSASAANGNKHVNGFVTPNDTLYVDTTDQTGAGEANTLSDTGTFNGTEGFGLAGGKTGTALKVKGLIEGANITIAASGDSAYTVTAAGGGATLEDVFNYMHHDIFDTIGFNDSIGIKANGITDGMVTDALTVTGYMQDEDINTFDELQSWVSDKTLVNEEDIFTIDANWVNTANPWADNEIATSGNWNTAYGWGDHSGQNYLDNDDANVDTLGWSKGRDSGLVAWNWGDHSAQSYVKSLLELYAYFDRTYFDTLIDASGDSIIVVYSDSTDLSIFDTDDLSEGSSNLYDQALPDSSEWSEAYDSSQVGYLNPADPNVDTAAWNAGGGVGLDTTQVLDILRDSISGDGTVGAGGALTIAANIVDTSDMAHAPLGKLIRDTITDEGYITDSKFSDSSITLLNATAWRLFYSNATTTAIQELILGSDGTYLKSNGASSAPTWATPGGAGWNWTDSTGFLVGWGGVAKSVVNDTNYFRFEGSSDFDTTGGSVSIADDAVDPVALKDSNVQAQGDLVVVSGASADQFGFKTVGELSLMEDEDINTFSELQAWVSGKTLVNEEDIFTIDANWVNTANPWAVNEVHADLLTATEGDAAYQPLEAILTDIADGIIDYNLDNTINPWVDNEVADNITIDNATMADSAQNIDTTSATATALIEKIADVAGAMTTGNTETGIAVTHQDGDNTIDFVVDVDIRGHTLDTAEVLQIMADNMSSDATIDNAGVMTVVDDLHDHVYSNIDATSSANWAGRVDDETGTGIWVFGTSPTFTTDLECPLVIGGTATTSDLSLKTTSGVGATGADMHFLVGNNGATEAMTVLNNGKVGIGINSPSSILHIKADIPGVIGSHSAGQLIIQNPTNSVFSNAVITGYESDAAGNPDQQLWYLGNSSVSNSDVLLLNRRASNLHLGTNGTTQLIIDANGNVGIGTVVPPEVLSVVGNIATGDTTTGDVDVYHYISTDGSWTSEYFPKWDDGLGRFEISDDLDVTGNITLSGTVDGVDVAALDAGVAGDSADWMSSDADSLVGIDIQAKTGNLQDNYILKVDIAGADTSLLWEADAGEGGALTYWTESDDNDTSVFTATGPNTTVGLNDNLTMQGNDITGVANLTVVTGITVPDNSISDEELDEDATFTWTNTHTFEVNLMVDDGIGNSPFIQCKDQDDNNLMLGKMDAGFSWIYNDEGALHFLFSDDVDDYIYMDTFSVGVPMISTGGACDLVINASSGEISFGDENLTTTGTLDAGATSVTGDITVTGTVDGVDLAALDTDIAGDSASWNKTADKPLFYMFTLADPDALYATDAEWSIDPRTAQAITIDSYYVSLTAPPSTELEFSLKFADALIGFPSATIIDDTTTLAGSVSVTGGFGDATVPAGKCIYILLDADPEDAITQASVKIYYTID